MRIVARGAVTRTARLVPLLLALLVLLAVAQVAAAAPPGPTMDLEQLAVALESGPLDGYLLTTMDGTTPEPITVQVQSLVDYSWGSLILFEASGPWIDRIGGIAAGMSGSPIYVDDGGVDKLVGALSYGDAFTLGGLGLATPIEYMAAIESDYAVGALAALQAPRPPAPGAYPLAEPVKTSAGVVRSVVVARSATAAASVGAASGQTVMTPLGILEIGGAKPGSKAFERVAARFEKTGLLIKAASGDGRWAGAPTPDLTGGSPCAILFSQGAVWVGAAGTVTYVDGESAMLFGHPFEQLGAIDAILTGGDVQGVWASSYTPYKLIAPRDVKGACVQDRNWGVQARLGQVPDLFPVATTVTIADRAVTVSDDSEVSEWLVTANAYPGLPGDIVAQVVWNAVDQYSYPGSAETVTTVVASDHTGTYTIEHENLWSNSWDVSYDAGSDAYSILSELAADPDGVIHPRVESVDVTATVSPTQRTARIAGVTLPDGIGVGDTTVRIEYYRYGSAELQTVDAILVIPAGTPLYGRLVVQPASWEGEEEGEGGSTVDSTPPQTLAELADELNGMPMNSDLIVSYQPGRRGRGRRAGCGREHRRDDPDRLRLQQLLLGADRARHDRSTATQGRLRRRRPGDRLRGRLERDDRRHLPPLRGLGHGGQGGDDDRDPGGRHGELRGRGPGTQEERDADRAHAPDRRHAAGQRLGLGQGRRQGVAVRVLAAGHPREAGRGRRHGQTPEEEGRRLDRLQDREDHGR